ncbi:transporter substrate-binding domain-containing protein [Bradyrhizobium murdochi]|uniref:transporter substrate-binding domain-containing protein n=1 Tax=Bradyrhizobium murdochi TaxID=1038859 RepID=UPI00040CE187|nr:transporter substrate-binding domain-containing protein [Bradyrhizobium murdochi]
MRSISKLSLLFLLLTSAGYSASTSAQTDDPLFASIRKAGEVKVALASLPPFMEVSPTGEAKGSVVEWQNQVLKGMGLPPLKGVLTEWTAMIPGLLSHQYDYAGAGLNITEASCKTVVFSRPTFAGQIGLFVLPGNPKHLTSIAELAHRPDIKVSVIRSSGQYEYLQKKELKSEQITFVPDAQAGVATVTGGRVDAFIVGQFTVTKPKEKGVEVIVDRNSPVYASGVAFRKESVKFRDAFDKQYSILFENGFMRELVKKYMPDNGEEVLDLQSKFTKASDVVPSCE